MFLLLTIVCCFYRERQEREAGIKPAEESDNDDIVMGNPFQPIGKHVVSPYLVCRFARGPIFEPLECIESFCLSQLFFH